MVYTCHTFFIHSSADGHLGCFHFLDTVNPGVCGSLSIVSGGAPRSDVAELYGSSVFSCLKGISTLPSVLAAPPDVPVRRVGGGPFLHTLSNLYCMWTL